MPGSVVGTSNSARPCRTAIGIGFARLARAPSRVGSPAAAPPARRTAAAVGAGGGGPGARCRDRPGGWSGRRAGRHPRSSACRLGRGLGSARAEHPGRPTPRVGRPRGPTLRPVRTRRHAFDRPGRPSGLNRLHGLRGRPRTSLFFPKKRGRFRPARRRSVSLNSWPNRDLTMRIPAATACRGWVFADKIVAASDRSVLGP